MKKISFLMSILIILFLGSCEKFVTEREQGKATVESNTYTVQPYQWVERGQYGEALYGFFVEINVPEITQDVLDNGLVMVYMNDGGEIVALPFIYTFDGYQSIFEYSLKLNIVRIYFFETDLLTFNLSYPITFKVVIVNDFGTMDITEEEVKDMEYEEVVLLNEQF